ncbi:MAG TPA: hypothetical protein DCR16_00850 [Lachnospiraceae bacterium]|nr:hypothetical protein [Lachnospiraceae bacterium]
MSDPQAAVSGNQFLSRSDSTLRGHYPLETEVLRKAAEGAGEHIDGEIICPFFKEGGQFTINNVHYVLQEEELIPAGHSDIAVRALGVKKARVMGQIRPSVPVWQTGEESRFPLTPYVIFPGNTGTEKTLREAVEILAGND